MGDRVLTRRRVSGPIFEVDETRRAAKRRQFFSERSCCPLVYCPSNTSTQCEEYIVRERFTMRPLQGITIDVSASPPFRPCLLPPLSYACLSGPLSVCRDKGSMFL